MALDWRLALLLSFRIQLYYPSLIPLSALWYLPHRGSSGVLSLPISTDLNWVFCVSSGIGLILCLILIWPLQPYW